MAHKLLKRYPSLKDGFLFLDVKGTLPAQVYPLMAEAPEDPNKALWSVWNDICRDYPNASDEDFYFTCRGVPCEEGAADTLWMRTGLEAKNGGRIWLCAKLNRRQDKTRWYVTGASDCDPSIPGAEAAEPDADRPLLERYPSFFDLVRFDARKIPERLIPMTGDSTLDAKKVCSAMDHRYQELGLEVCRFTQKGKECAPEEADTLMFSTGYTDTAGKAIRLQCERNKNAKREPWFGKYFNSEDWVDRGEIGDFLDKVQVYDSHLLNGLSRLMGVEQNRLGSADGLRLKMARYVSALPPERIRYLNGFLHSSEEAATHMLVPTGFFSPDGQEIMLRCKRSTIGWGKPWVSRRFYLSADNDFDGREPGNWLFAWARFKSPIYMDISEELRQLKDMAAEENWSFPGRDDSSILRNYLVYTFVRLWREGKVLESRNGKFAAFNTGLVNSAYEYIYALFELWPAENDVRQWQFMGFCIPGENANGKTMARNFPRLPNPARYFAANEPIYYCFNDDLPVGAQLPWCDAEHILTERTYRLPMSFLRRHTSGRPAMEARLAEIETVQAQKAQKDRKNLSEQDVEELRELSAREKVLWDALSQLIRDDGETMYRMTADLDKAVETAVKRAAWNYRTVIPYYNPRDDIHNLLLPISFSGVSTPDVALVVEPNYGIGDDGSKAVISYTGHTIITLGMAYKNSRLVCRPESDWLNMAAVDHTAATEALDDGEEFEADDEE